MENLTFKQYLESKEKLREAVGGTPTSVIEYEVRKYCTFMVGETIDEKKCVGLKPKQRIIIEWRYDSIDTPTANSIKFRGPKDIEEHEDHCSFWSTKKLQNWLVRHTIEGSKNGY